MQRQAKGDSLAECALAVFRSAVVKERDRGVLKAVSGMETHLKVYYCKIRRACGFTRPSLAKC